MPTDSTRSFRDTWHFDKSIHISHILSTVVIATSVVFYLAKLEQRVALLEQASIEAAKRDDRQDQRLNEQVLPMRAELVRINDKLDRLIESMRRK